VLRARGVKWDLGLLRVSLACHVSAYLLISTTLTERLFIFAIVFSCTGAAFLPTCQSIALEIYHRHGGTEDGKLLGAFSTLSTLGYAGMFSCFNAT
jgi:MFS family permease